MPPRPTADSYPGVPGTTLYAGRASAPPPGPGTLLTTRTLVNETLSEQPGGFITPFFGVSFVQGDVPDGDWPQFETEDGVPCPYTHWGKKTWPDGSLKFMAFMVRFPQAVPALGSKPLRVKNGGAVPTSGARTLTDATSADLNVLLNGITNLTGQWAAHLNDAITAADDIVTYGSGAAGALYRVGGHMKQSGSPHGQLYCWHYLGVLQNSSSGLLGVRYLGRAAQPFADVLTPTPTRRVVTAALRSGATTIRALQGFDLTETLGDNINLPHYSSFFSAGVDGRWDFFQSGGSATSDCVVRVVHDKTYLIRSRMVPPYDTTLEPSQNTAVDYRPMGKASMNRNFGTTGEWEYIGVLPSWAVRHILTGSAVDERACRANGLSAGSWRQCARKISTKQIVPVADPSPSYVGMGPVEKFWRGPQEYVYGFVNPTDKSSLWGAEYEPSHRPGAVYYPYLMTGEPQYLDMLVEQANGILSGSISEDRTMRTTLPITSSTIYANSDYGERDVVINGTLYKGAGYLFTGNLSRVAAWGTRDMAQAAAIYPDLCPEGTEVGKYFNELCEQMHTAMNVYNASLGPDWATSGIYSFMPDPDDLIPWGNGYLSNSICHQASILGTASAQAFRAYLAQGWERLAIDRDIATVFSFDGNIYDENTTRVTRIEDMLTSIGTPIVFSTATSRFTVNGAGIWSAWQPTNGDVIAFFSNFDSDKPFTGAVDCKRFYVVNASGFTGQLSATPGGAPIPVTADVTVGKFFARIQNFAPNVTAEALGPSTYIANITSAIKHHAAVGDFVPTALAEASAKLAASGISFVSDPKNAFSSSYPSD